MTLVRGWVPWRFSAARAVQGLLLKGQGTQSPDPSTRSTRSAQEAGGQRGRGCGGRLGRPAGAVRAGALAPAAGQRRVHGTPLLLEEKKQKKGLFYEMGVIFSREGMERRNKALQEEVTRGQFFEVKELDKTGGKIFEADIDLIPSAEAITFPDITCTTLDGSEVSTHDVLGGKVTLVTVSLREFARPMVNTWTTHFHSKVGSNPHAQIVPLAFMEGYVYKLFKGLLMSGMKKNYTEEQKKGALVAFQSSEDFRRTFDMRNRLVGYAFLVDQNRKVRWRGVGYALIHEGKALTDCANKLLTVR